VWIHFDVRYDAQRVSHPHAGAYESELDERAALLQPAPRETWGIEVPIVIPPALTQLFRDGVPRLVRRWKVGGPVAVLDATTQLSSLLATFIGHLYEASSTSPTLSVEARIARAETMALRSLDTGIDVEDLAATAGYSRTRFSAIYQQIRGKSPGLFLRQERLRPAENLLSRPELPIAKVGELVGYPDPTVFGRFFRSHHQMSPGEWRKRNGGGV
jgi:AraC-like DNA-binding protein